MTRCWRCGVPLKGSADFAYMQHMVHHLALGSVAGSVFGDGSISSSQPGEGEIRKKPIDADPVDCMVALLGQSFHSTQIPTCLWCLARCRPWRGEVLFINARKLGRMQRELTYDDVARITGAYRAWHERLNAAIAENLKTIGFGSRVS